MCPTGWTKPKFSAGRAFFNFHLMEFTNRRQRPRRQCNYYRPIPRRLFSRTETRVYTRYPRIDENSRALCPDARVQIRWLPLSSLAIGSFPSAFSFRDTRTFLLALEHLESSPFSLALLFYSDCVDATRFADPETTLRPLMTLRARTLKRYYKNSFNWFGTPIVLVSVVRSRERILELSINYHSTITI